MVGLHYPWGPMGTHEQQRVPLHGCPWVPMEYPLAPTGTDGNRYSLVLMDARGYPRLPMGSRRCPLVSMCTHGCSYVPMNTHGDPWAALGTDGHSYGRPCNDGIQMAAGSLIAIMMVGVEGDGRVTVVDN